MPRLDKRAHRFRDVSLPNPDEELEQRIAQARENLLNAEKPDEKMAHQATLKELISRRSAQQIEKMERDRGLA